MRRNIPYEMARDFLRKYPLTVAWRLWEHSKVVDQYVGDDEKVAYAFVAQESQSSWDIITTCVVALTDKRIIIGRKRLLWGYFCHSITPDMYNDIEIFQGLIWGKIDVDTIKEKVHLSNIDRNALAEIEEQITTHIIELKKQYGLSGKIKNDNQ